MEGIEVDVEPVLREDHSQTGARTGEYALVEIDANGAANQFVWDFGVNPMLLPVPSANRPDEETGAGAHSKPKKILRKGDCG